LEALGALLPQYAFLEVLGVGGMGAVYLARQIALDRTVAVKILPPSLEDANIDYAERFKIEARTMAKLSNVGIVGVHDFGETQDGQLYFVMEHVDGTDLYKLIKESGRLPQSHALAITAHVCDALAYAHSHGVIHRDIKPANILIARNGQIKVADFGLAKLDGHHDVSVTGENIVLGTPDFVAPEALIAGVTVDGRADLYAVGVMLYNMLTGQVPQAACMPASVLMPGQVSPNVDAIIGKAMQADPQLRYLSAQELRMDIDRIFHTPAAAVAEQVPEAAPPAAQIAKPLNGRLIGGLAAAAAVLVAGYFLLAPRPPSEPPLAEKTPAVAPVAEATPEKVATMTASAPETPKRAEHRDSAPLTDLRGESSRYRFVPGHFDRAAAVAKAAELGGRLVRVETSEEMEWLWEKIVIQSLYVGQRVWVDGAAQEKGDWRWSDGSQTGELPWASAQPKKTVFPAYIDLFRNDDEPGLYDFNDKDTPWQAETVGVIVEWPLKNEAPAVAMATPTPAPPAEKMTPSEPSPPAPVPIPAPAVVPEMPKILSATEQRLSQIEGSFQAACARDAGQAFTAALQTLSKGYLGAIARARTAAQTKGSLDEITALDGDKTLIEKGESLPPADLPSLPASALSLRQTYRATLARHTAERDRKIRPLYQRYLETLAANEAELTRANQIADAKLVRETRDKVADAMSLLADQVPANTPPVAVVKATADKSAAVVIGGSSWRQLATWVISLGGAIEATKDGQSSRVTEIKDIPTGKFEVTGIDLSEGKAAKATDKDFTLLVTAKNLRELVLSGAVLTSLEPLRGLTQLATVYLEGCPNLDDTQLAVLGSLPALTELNLNKLAIQGTCFKSLATCPKLVRLSLNEILMSDENLPLLSGLKSLAELRLYSLTKVTDEGIRRFGETCAVQKLAIEGNHYTGEGWETLGRSGKLHSLVLDYTRPTAEGLAAIARITSLRRLEIEDGRVTDDMLEAFIAWSKLEELSIESCPITGTGLQALAACKGLHTLALNGDTALTDEGLQIIATQFPRLESLQLGKGSYTVTGISALTALKTLRSLQIVHAAADDACVSPLAKLAQLQDLSLVNWQITQAAIEEFKSFKTLRNLSITQSKTLNDTALTALKELKRLSGLYLTETGITAEGITQLRKALPGVDVNG